MISKENYYKEFAKLDVSELSESIKKVHDLINEFTKKGQDWRLLEKGDESRKMLEMHFKKIEKEIQKQGNGEDYPAWTQGEGLHAGDEAALRSIWNLYKKGEFSAAFNVAMSNDTEVREAIPPDIWLELGGQLTPTGMEKLKALKKARAKDKPHKSVQQKAEEQVSPNKKYNKGEKPKPLNEEQKVEHFPEEFKFMRRFVNLNGKTKTRDQILAFIITLQRSIAEKRMSKDSPFRKQIDFIQDALVRNYNNMNRSIPVKIGEKVIAEFKEILGEKVIYPSVKFIKQFISIQGKYHMRERARRLFDALNKASEKETISKTDKYYDKLKSVYERLRDFIKKPKEKKIEVEPSELSGLQEVLGCPCEEQEPEKETREANQEAPLAGVNYGGRSPQIMNSMEFVNLHFEKLGFKGKWKDFIGDPSRGFTMGVFALPKMGKSTLCIEFAGYLARNHGTVLYVAREEGLDRTLQDKLNATEVKHPNLTVSSFLPEDISIYNFVFLDSVNKLGLSPEELEALKKKFPAQSFIFIFQSTKEGKIRGKNEYLHDVDIIVEIQEIGRAIQNGRFNQGGKMNVFEKSNNEDYGDSE